MSDLTAAVTVGRTPAEAFAAVIDPRAWWSEEIAGSPGEPGAEFTYRFAEVHRCRFRVTELLPGRRVAWHVVESYFDFTADPAEWTGTTIELDVAPDPAGARIRLTHRGLSAAHECYDVCSTSWAFYVGTSLRELLETGTGRPNGRETANVPAERAGLERTR